LGTHDGGVVNRHPRPDRFTVLGERGPAAV
jgi:hypothetical protein